MRLRAATLIVAFVLGSLAVPPGANPQPRAPGQSGRQRDLVAAYSFCRQLVGNAIQAPWVVKENQELCEQEKAAVPQQVASAQQGYAQKCWPLLGAAFQEVEEADRLIRQAGRTSEQQGQGQLMSEGNRHLALASAKVKEFDANCPPSPLLHNPLIQLGAEMEVVATQNIDHFLTGFAEMLGDMARFWGQKPGQPPRQIVEAMPKVAAAVILYLNNDDATKQRVLYDAATSAVEEYKRDPARLLGRHALDLAWAGGNVVKLAQAGRRVGEIAQAARAFKNAMAGGVGCRLVDKVDCFMRSVAVDQLPGWRRGDPVHTLPVMDTDMTTAPVKTALVIKVLREQYGGRNAKDPGLSRLGGLGQQAHAHGIPVPVQSPAELMGAIERAARAAGQKPVGGILFVRYPDRPIGHSFNWRRVNGVTEFWDHQQRMNGLLWLPQVKEVRLFRSF